MLPEKKWFILFQCIAFEMFVVFFDLGRVDQQGKLCDYILFNLIKM